VVVGVEGFSEDIGPAAKEDEESKTTDIVIGMVRNRICSTKVLSFNVIKTITNRKKIAENFLNFVPSTGYFPGDPYLAASPSIRDTNNIGNINFSSLEWFSM
jgi:hypothetical protein